LFALVKESPAPSILKEGREGRGRKGNGASTFPHKRGVAVSFSKSLGGGTAEEGKTRKTRGAGSEVPVRGGSDPHTFLWAKQKGGV